MLEGIVGKKNSSMTKAMLKKQLEKSGKANELKVFLGAFLTKLLKSILGQIERFEKAER